MLIDRQVWIVVKVRQRLSNRVPLCEYSLASVEERNGRLIELQPRDLACLQQLHLRVMHALLIRQKILRSCQGRQMLPINRSQHQNTMLLNC
jgi:hypothetical protein